MKELDRLVTLEIAIKLKKIGYWSENGCKYGWFKRKRGKEWELLPLTSENFIACWKFLFAPTLEETRKWIRDNFKYYPEVTAYKYIDIDSILYDVELYQGSRYSKVRVTTVGARFNDKREAYIQGILIAFRYNERYSKSKI